MKGVIEKYNLFLLKKSLRYKRTARPVSDIVNKQKIQDDTIPKSTRLGSFL